MSMGTGKYFLRVSISVDYTRSSLEAIARLFKKQWWFAWNHAMHHHRWKHDRTYVSIGSYCL